jgi:hypothetical protein
MKTRVEQLEVENKKFKKFFERLLNPEDLGFAVTGEIRDHARMFLGLKPVESWLKNTHETITK